MQAMNAQEQQRETEIQALRDEIQHLRSELSAAAKAARERAAHIGEAVYGEAREAATKVRHQASRASETVAHQIEERPFMSVMIGFLIGLLIGALLARQR